MKLCCFCGMPNFSGIFVREDPTSELLLCVGVHPGETASVHPEEAEKAEG